MHHAFSPKIYILARITSFRKRRRRRRPPSERLLIPSLRAAVAIVSIPRCECVCLCVARRVSLVPQSSTISYTYSLIRSHTSDFKRKTCSRRSKSAFGSLTCAVCVSLQSLCVHACICVWMCVLFTCAVNRKGSLSLSRLCVAAFATNQPPPPTTESSRYTTKVK